MVHVTHPCAARRAPPPPMRPQPSRPGVQLQIACARRLFRSQGTSHVMLLDGAHNTNRERFMLIPAVMVNEHGNGEPIAWLVTSSQESKEEMAAFIEDIRRTTGCNSVNFISDKGTVSAALIGRAAVFKHSHSAQVLEGTWPAKHSCTCSLVSEATV